MKNIIEFLTNVIDRSQEVYDTLIKFLDEHRALVQLYEITTRDIDTFNDNLKIERKFTKT